MEHPAQRMIPFPLRLHPSPIEDEADWPLPKRSKLDLEPGEVAEGKEEGTEEAIPRKKKVRRGTRAGRIAKENQRIRDERARQAEELFDAAEENEDGSFVEWVSTLDVVAEAEAAEAIEAEFLAGNGPEEEEARRWEPMVDDDPPIAQGPY